MPNTFSLNKDMMMTYSPPLYSPLALSYTRSESISHKLGLSCRRTVNYLKSKKGKKKALQAYIISEGIISTSAVISLLLVKMYLPAIGLILMFTYLVYAASSAF
jgi:hypothetical protein